MRRMLFLINVVLTIVAVILTGILKKTWNRHQTLAGSEGGDGMTQQSLAIPAEESGRPAVAGLIKAEAIWQRNLFDPDRIYEEVTTNELDIKEPDEVTEHFELVSIAQVHKRSCASIRVITGGRPPPQRSIRDRRSRPRATSRATQRQAQDKSQKVYMLNDPVGETGFILAQIGIDFIVLKKGEQEITLRLDTGDEGSEQRREVALKKEEERVREEEKARQLAERQKLIERAKARQSTAAVPADQNQSGQEAQNTPPPPPPPPPPPAVPGVDNVPASNTPSVQSQSQRIRRARQSRTDRSQYNVDK